jgi:hypothetical protein
MSTKGNTWMGARPVSSFCLMNCCWTNFRVGLHPSERAAFARRTPYYSAVATTLYDGRLKLV